MEWTLEFLFSAILAPYQPMNVTPPGSSIHRDSLHMTENNGLNAVHIESGQSQLNREITPDTDSQGQEVNVVDNSEFNSATRA